VQSIENHDHVYRGRELRIARLADAADSRSWYARSRARVATALLLTAPGIPMLFMGQEILEDKRWSDTPRFPPASLIWWDGGSGQWRSDHCETERAGWIFCERDGSWCPRIAFSFSRRDSLQVRPKLLRSTDWLIPLSLEYW
jgi:hypothetical protein